MNKSTRAKLEQTGFKVGSADEFIGLSVAEKLMVDVLERLSPATRQAYTADLTDFTRHLKLESPAAAVQRLLAGSFEETDKLVRGYRAEILGKRELSSATINRRLSMLRKFTKAANRRGLSNWTLDVPNVKDETAQDLSGPDNAAMTEILSFAAKDESVRGKRAYAVLRLMADLGLRRAAVQNLDFSDLKLELRPKKLRVRLKGRERKRWKELPHATLTALKRWIGVHPCRSRRVGPVFVNLVVGRHTRLSGPAIYNLVTEYSENAGCRTRPHGIRHTAITNAITQAAEVGETLDSVREFSDHKDFRMVLRYRDKSKGAAKKFSKANAETFGDPLQ